MSIVPDTRGTIAVVVQSRRTRARPTAADVYVERVPVIAWSIENGLADPILAMLIGIDAVVMLELPDGGFYEPGICRYDDIEDVKTQAIERAQDAWDRRPAPKPAAETQAAE